jgi:siroheme synthase-like protein
VSQSRYSIVRVQMTWFPIFVSLEGRRCLVVGGGPIGTRKAAGLRDAGAVVTLVATQLSPQAKELAATGVQLVERPYVRSDLAGQWLVISAVDDRSVAAQVSNDAQSEGIFANAADDPEFCSFILPAIHRDGDVQIAVSTGGSSPATASWLRDRVAIALGTMPGRLVDHMKSVRDRIRLTQTSEGLPWGTLVAPASFAIDAHDDEMLNEITEQWIAKNVTSKVSLPTPDGASRE